VPLPPGATELPIATIRAVATAPIAYSPANPCGTFGTRADTQANSVVTVDARCDAPATGGAMGSTQLFIPQPTGATATPTPVVTPTASATPACAAVPQSGCRRPVAERASQIVLADRARDRRDLLTWKWTKGAGTLKTAFGDPSTTTDYALCVYDRIAGTPALVVAARIPAGGVCAGKLCWRATKRGFRYADPNGAADGVTAVTLKEGLDGASQIRVKAVGSSLAMPTLPLAQDPAVTVQMTNALGECWDADFGAPAIDDDETEFRDRSD